MLLKRLNKQIDGSYQTGTIILVNLHHAKFPSQPGQSQYLLTPSRIRIVIDSFNMVPAAATSSTSEAAEKIHQVMTKIRVLFWN